VHNSRFSLALPVRSACLRQPLQVQRKAQSIFRFVSLRVPCTIAAVNLDCTRNTQCLPPPAPSQVTKDTKYSRKICVIARPLYSQGSQRQLCKEHALSQNLYILCLLMPFQGRRKEPDARPFSTPPPPCRSSALWFFTHICSKQEPRRFVGEAS